MNKEMNLMWPACEGSEEPGQGGGESRDGCSQAGGAAETEEGGERAGQLSRGRARSQQHSPHPAVQ